MTEKMVKYEAKEVEQYVRRDVYGAEVLDRGDLIMPRVRVRQPVSKFGEPGDAGKLHNNLTETFSDGIEAVVLRISKGRVMWPEAFDGASEPLCASDDAFMPREGNGLRDRQPGPCAECAGGKWGEDGTPPACSLVYTYLCADRGGDDMPFMISAMRTSAKAAKKLNTLIKMFGIKKAMKIRTELVKGDQGQWYELVFQVASDLTPPEVQRYAGMAASLSGVSMTVDTEPTSDLDEGDFGGTEPEGLGF
jgi:hypothetical protein